MRSVKKRVLVAAVSLVVMPLTMASMCNSGGGPNTLPKSGVILEITPGSVACADQQPRTVAVRYTPDGTDPKGAPWPTGLLCVIPETAKNLAVGGRVQG